MALASITEDEIEISEPQVAVAAAASSSGEVQPTSEAATAASLGDDNNTSETSVIGSRDNNEDEFTSDSRQRPSINPELSMYPSGRYLKTSLYLQIVAL